LRTNGLTRHTIIVMPGSYSLAGVARFDLNNVETSIVCHGGVTISVQTNFFFDIRNGAGVSFMGYQYKPTESATLAGASQMPGAAIISQDQAVFRINGTAGKISVSLHNIALITKTSAPAIENSIFDVTTQNLEQLRVLIDNCMVSIDDIVAGLWYTRALASRTIFEMYDTAVWHQGVCLVFDDPTNPASQLYYKLRGCTFTSAQSNTGGVFGHISTTLAGSQNCFGTLSGNGFYDTNSLGAVYVHYNSTALLGNIDAYSPNITTSSGLLNMNYLTPGITLLSGQPLNDPQFYTG